MLNFKDSLKEISSILDSYEVYWFLEGGACLGYVREKGFLSHDHDLDIGIYCSMEDAENLINQLPVCNKFYFEKRLTFATIHLDCYIDIFFFFDYEYYIVETMHSLFLNRVKFLAYDPKVIKEGVKRTIFEGIEVNVLINSVDYCETLYGSNYLIPDKNWSGWEDPKNILIEQRIRKEFVEEYTIITNENKNVVINYALNRTADVLRVYGSDNYNLGLNNGVAGLALFFFKYSTLSEDAMYYNIASVYLDRLFKLLNNELDLSYKNGFCGIGWVVEYLIQNSFIEGNAEEILQEIDSFIFCKIDIEQIIHDLSIEELSDMCNYFFIKLKNDQNKNNFSKFINSISLFKNLIEGKLSFCIDFSISEIKKAVYFLLNVKCISQEFINTENLEELLTMKIIELNNQSRQINPLGYEDYYSLLENYYLSWHFFKLANSDLCNKSLENIERLISIRYKFVESKYILSTSKRLRVVKILDHIQNNIIIKNKVINKEIDYWFSDILISRDNIEIDDSFIYYAGYTNYNLVDGLLGFGVDVSEIKNALTNS